MLDCEANSKNNKQLKAEKSLCESCEKEVETQSHVLQCQDKILYFRDVLKLRMK